jgi:predicted lipoprotein
MNLIWKGSVLGALILSGVIVSCKKNNDTQPGGSNPSTFEDQRPAMLANMGNNIILPHYQLLNKAVNSLDSAVIAFNSNPDSANLSHLQSIFKDAYLKWQSCSAIDFGPATPVNLSVSMNTFPVDTTKINANIQSSTAPNLAAISNLDAKGFPGLDFLLFGTGSTASSILSKYTTDSNAAGRKTYLAAISADIKTQINTVVTAWLPSGGNYIQTFVSAAGTDQGSSVGLLINAMDADYEVLKNYKIGIPLGKFTMGVQYPEKVESYYSQVSVQLALAQLTNIQSIYLGKSGQGDGLGLDDYLEQVNTPQYNGSSLNTSIKNQFSLTISKLQALADPLSSTIQNNPAAVDAAYVEIQKLLVLLKTDMPSALGILITYGDNDGD